LDEKERKSGGENVPNTLPQESGAFKKFGRLQG